MNLHRHTFKIISFNKEANPRYYCCENCPLILKEEVVKSSNPKEHYVTRITIIRDLE